MAPLQVRLSFLGVGRTLSPTRNEPPVSDLDAQATAVDERCEHLLAGHLDEVQARLAEADAADDDRADLEVPGRGGR
jgi:hypothetical protein